MIQPGRGNHKRTHTRVENRGDLQLIAANVLVKRTGFVGGPIQRLERHRKRFGNLAALHSGLEAP